MFTLPIRSLGRLPCPSTPGGTDPGEGFVRGGLERRPTFKQMGSASLVADALSHLRHQNSLDFVRLAERRTVKLDPLDMAIGDAAILYFGETHRFFAPKAMFVRLLRALRDLGFTHLAMEGLICTPGRYGKAVDEKAIADDFRGRCAWGPQVAEGWIQIMRCAASLAMTVVPLEDAKQLAEHDRCVKRGDQRGADSLRRQANDGWAQVLSPYLEEGCKVLVYAGALHVTLDENENPLNRVLAKKNPNWSAPVIHLREVNAGLIARSLFSATPIAWSEDPLGQAHQVIWCEEPSGAIDPWRSIV